MNSRVFGSTTTRSPDSTNSGTRMVIPFRSTASLRFRPEPGSPRAPPPTISTPAPLFRHLELVVAPEVHEVAGFAVVVEELHLPEAHVRLLELLPRLEGLAEERPGDDVAELAGDECGRAPRRGGLDAVVLER